MYSSFWKEYFCYWQTGVKENPSASLFDTGALLGSTPFFLKAKIKFHLNLLSSRC